MKRKRILLMVAGILALSSMPVSAAPQIQVTMEDEETDKTEGQDDPEIEYAYSGKDYIYARADYGADSYAVGRKAYGSFLKRLNGIGTTEEFFSPSMIVKEDGEAVKEDVLVKDTSTPWNDWSDEQWDEYIGWVRDFIPDAWQETLLKYYSEQEIFAYYMGYGYTIDEWAVKEQALIDEAKENGTYEPEMTVSEEPYEKVIVTYDLDSMYEKTVTYCITEDKIPELDKLLSDFGEFDEKTADITDPNTFLLNRYHFEIGSMDEYITSYRKVEAADAKKAVAYLNKNKLPADDADEDSYKVRVRTKNNKKNAEKIYTISHDAFITLISKYLGTNSDRREEYHNYVADDAKG